MTRIADSTGGYRASNIPAGAYTVTGFTGPGDAFHSTRSQRRGRGPAEQGDRNIVLGPEPSPPPDGTTIGPRIDTTRDGVPSAYWGDPLDITTQGCQGATADLHARARRPDRRSGPLTEGPPGTFTGEIPALQPDHGTGEIRVEIDCPGALPAQDVDFGIDIDPSGVVRDAAGNLVPGAEVTLYRSGSPDGPFFAVPDESAVMSPSNRGTRTSRTRAGTSAGTSSRATTSSRPSWDDCTGSPRC